MGYTPSKANQNKFLQNFISNVKTKFVASKPTPNPTQVKLDAIQKKLNPYIAQAQKNAGLISNYISKYSAPQTPSRIGISPKVSVPSPSLTAYNHPQFQQPVDDSASYLPVIQGLTDLIRQKGIYNSPESVDLSPYLSQADTIRQRRESMV